MTLPTATIVKYGGGAFGDAREHVGLVLERIAATARDGRLLVVVSAPRVTYDGRAQSLTDVALAIGAAWAAGERCDLEPLFAPLDALARAHCGGGELASCLAQLSACRARAEAALAESFGEGRIHDGPRARLLAWSGELAMAEVVAHALRSAGVRAASIPFDRWPLVTDAQFEHANFRLAASIEQRGPLLELLGAHDVVVIGGFIGRTADGQETTFGRGGSDRSAIDLAIALRDRFDLTVRMEKEVAVFSADPRWERRSLEQLRYLSWDEAQMAAILGMRILDPMAIRDLEEHEATFAVEVADLHDPTKVTQIGRAREEQPTNALKLVVGRKGCAIVRMAETAASQLVHALRVEREYTEFIQLSEIVRLGRRTARILFLDGEFVRRQEALVRSFDPDAELVHGRGVVAVIGDHVWSAPAVVSSATGALGADVRITAIDVQEETSRLLFVLDDVGDAVPRAVRAIHAQRLAFATAHAPPLAPR